MPERLRRGQGFLARSGFFEGSTGLIGSPGGAYGVFFAMTLSFWVIKNCRCNLGNIDKLDVRTMHDALTF